MKQKGQIPIVATVLIASSTIIASAFGAWATASSKVSDVSAKVQVVEERENNHYLEVSKKLDSIEQKLDALIKK